MIGLRRNWREYAIEATGAGILLLAASVIATLLSHPASPTAPHLAPAWIRRALMGGGMGATLYALVHSHWGRRSGAHFNPAVTLTFFRLGRVAPADAIGYVVAHFTGAAIGIFTAVSVLRVLVGADSVDYVVTVPGSAGVAAAFTAELVISFLLMTTILTSMSSERFAAHTGALVAVLLAVFIALEAPLSGTSMNPARTFAADLAAAQWTAFWVYLVAPTAAMLIAAEQHRRRAPANDDACAKLVHDPALPCIFCAYRHGESVRVPDPASENRGAGPIRAGGSATR
jgi:aquaporin Z